MGGGGSGPPQTTTTQTKNEPWADQQPFLKFGFDEAKNQYNSAQPQFYSGQTYANQSPETQASLNMMTDRALQGSPSIRAADQSVADTAGGKYLGQGNPYYDQLVNTAQRSIAPGIESRYAQGGRFGSAGMKEAVSRGVSDAVVPQLFQDYGNERNRMLQASTMAPQIAQASYLDPSMLQQIGSQREQFSQQGINEDIARYNYNQNLQSNKLAQFMNLVQGQYGGESLSTSTAPGAPKADNTGAIIGGIGSMAVAAAMIY